MVLYKRKCIYMYIHTPTYPQKKAHTKLLGQIAWGVYINRHIYIHTYMCMYIYIYIYPRTDIKSARAKSLGQTCVGCVYAYSKTRRPARNCSGKFTCGVCVHIYMFIYIRKYIYIFTHPHTHKRRPARNCSGKFAWGVYI